MLAVVVLASGVRVKNQAQTLKKKIPNRQGKIFPIRG
jgi:hypothetical protein